MSTDTKIIEKTLDKIHEFYNELDEEIRTHLFYMIDTVSDMQDTRKINRWLGFIHGTLVALTDCTVDELRNICR